MVYNLDSGIHPVNPNQFGRVDVTTAIVTVKFRGVNPYPVWTEDACSFFAGPSYEIEGGFQYVGSAVIVYPTTIESNFKFEAVDLVHLSSGRQYPPAGELTDFPRN
jgi:hypothetical protein